MDECASQSLIDKNLGGWAMNLRIIYLILVPRSIAQSVITMVMQKLRSPGAASWHLFSTFQQ